MKAAFTVTIENIEGDSGHPGVAKMKMDISIGETSGEFEPQVIAAIATASTSCVATAKALGMDFTANGKTM